jgi:tripartite ATP-independent transporter DctM subunit
VLGGIYFGVFTPTEAAAIGAVGAVVLGIIMNRLSLKGYMDAIFDTGRLSAMVFAIIIGGILFARFMVLTGVTENLVSLIVGLGINRYFIIGLLVVPYMVMGMFFEVLAMFILTLPIVYPVILDLGFDPVWFGVFIAIMAELALVTPPIGANCFVIHGVAPDIPLADVFRGVIPFFIGDFTLICLLIFFPQIALWLPSTMLQ